MPRDEAAILALVETGVRRFILKGSPIRVLHDAVLQATKAGGRYKNPLTGEVFRRIVKQAIEERGRRRVKKTPPR